MNPTASSPTGPTPDSAIPLAESLLRSLVLGPLPKDLAEAALPGIQALGPSDIIEAVDALVGEALAGQDLDALKPGVTRLLHLCRQPLEAGPPAPPSPLFDLLVRENQRALAAADALRPGIALLTSPDTEAGSLREAVLGRARDELARGLEALAPIGDHYSRLENVLFPWFEARHPRHRCLSLMWSIHDDVRASMRGLGSLAAQARPEAQDLGRLAGRLSFDLRALVFREERILYPVVAALIGPEEQLGLYEEARSLGGGLLSAEDLALLDASAAGWRAALAALGARTSTAATGVPGVSGGPRGPGRPAQEAISLDAGSLSPLAIDLILKRLHLDMTFIDRDNRVAWFSNGPHRIFPRTPSVIGRDVKNCHPHESLGRVLGLIEDFREGRRESEAFWIRMKGRLIHIEYFALRDGAGGYLGVLEASEDLTDKIALTGEKRLASS